MPGKICCVVHLFFQSVPDLLSDCIKQISCATVCLFFSEIKTILFYRNMFVVIKEIIVLVSALKLRSNALLCFELHANSSMPKNTVLIIC